MNGLGCMGAAFGMFITILGVFLCSAGVLVLGIFFLIVGIVGLIASFSKDPPKEVLLKEEIPTKTQTSQISPIYGSVDVIYPLRYGYYDCVEYKNRFIAFDLETTGFNEYHDEIIEISAVRFEDGNIINTFSTLINPGIHIPEVASAVNHITDEMVESAKDKISAMNEFMEFIGEDIDNNIPIVAHNVFFDAPFLKSALATAGFTKTIKMFDTLILSRCVDYGVKNHKLATLSEFHNIDLENAHRAESDAIACGKLFYIYLNKIIDKYNERLNLLPPDMNLLIVSLREELYNKNVDNFCYFKCTENFINLEMVGTIFKLKYDGRLKYFLINNGFSDDVEDFVFMNPTEWEKSHNFIRLKYNNDSDIPKIIPLVSDIYDEYCSTKYYKLIGQYNKSEYECYIKNIIDNIA